MKRRLFLLALLTSLSLTGCDILDSLPDSGSSQKDSSKDDDKEVKLESISIFGSLSKRNYIVGEEWDTNGLNVKGVYSNGETKTLDPTEYTFDFDHIKPMKSITTLIVWAYTLDKKIVSEPASYTVSVADAEDTLKSISLRGDLEHYQYYIDEKWDSTGLWVEGTYTSGTKKELDSEEYELIFNPSQPEEDVDFVSIKARLKNGGLETDAYPFNVDIYERVSPEITIQSIEITEDLIKKDYYEGDTWDLRGLQILAHYSDGSSSNIPNEQCDFILYPEVPSVGVKSLSVTAILKENDEIESEPAYFSVSVQEIPVVATGIEIRGELETNEYDEGDEWDPTGLEVYTLYSDGSEEELEFDEYDLVFDPMTALKGTTSVKVIAYDEHGFESDPEFCDVIVHEQKVLTELEIRGILTCTSYNEGDYWNHDGLSVYGIYNDQSEVLLDESEFIFIDNPATALKGTTKLTVRAKLNGSSLMSASREFAVTVTSEEDPPTNYTVTFNSNGGTGTMNPQQTNGSEFIVPDCDFTKDGYCFTNWALNSKTGVSYSPGETIKNISNNLTLYAIWEKDSSGGDDTYYSECAGLSGSALQAKLKSINAPKSPSYDWSRYEDADEALDDSTSILCVYTRHNIKKNSHCGTYAWDKWNREHVWTQSAYKASASDNHNIFACEGQINNYRGNLPYNEGGTVVTVFGHTTECKMVSGTSFEPCDAAKGEIARSVMYGTVMYSYTMTNIINSIALALKWHLQHPITERDIKRNEIVYGNQGNRNPFVDHPEYACKIWGNTNSQTKQICGM